jgi:enamine deaminase RidA (YjgF/YER057c/UK114 family)
MRERLGSMRVVVDLCNERLHMKRTDVNPWGWGEAFGLSQGVQLAGVERVLVCSGQTAIGPDGKPPQTEDMAEQLGGSLANLADLVNEAGMTLADVVKITVYTTDMDAFLANYHMVVEAFAPNRPAVNIFGITRFAFLELKVEIDALAVQ